MRPQSSLPTQPTLSTQTNESPPCPIVALLREDTREIRMLRPIRHVVIGRSIDAHLYIDDTRVSRLHATIERRPDCIVVRAQGRMRVDNTDVHEAVIYAGQRFELRGIGFIALTDAMRCACPDLDRLVGDPRTVRDLLAMPPGQHAILLGVFGALLGKIAEHHHAALTGSDACFVDTSIGLKRDSPMPDIERLLPATKNGRIFLDGRRREPKGRSFPPRLPAPLLERLARRDQRTALTLGVHTLKDADIDFLLTGCAHFRIPPIKDRLVVGRREHLIDTAFKSIDSQLRTRHLHPDFIAALVNCPWSGDYKAFLAILTFARCAWRNDKNTAKVMDDTYGKRLTPWLDEAKLSWDRLRELPPDVGDTRRSAHPDAT